LRKRRGLSLRGVAVLMERPGTGACNLLSRLERGDLKHPSVNLLLDYLRACGTGPQDVAASFSPYLSLPPVPRTKGDAAVKKLLEVLPEREQRAVLAWALDPLTPRSLHPCFSHSTTGALEHAGTLLCLTSISPRR
jgi:hypothetical protein